MILLAQNYDYATDSWPGCWEWIILDATCKAPFKNPGFAFPFFLGSLACLIISVSALIAVKPKQQVIVKSVKHTPADLMNYVLPYVVSFMSIDYQETGKFVGFSIFMIWMFWITHASGQVILNPLLTVFKWQLYEVSYRYPADSVEYTGRALSRVHLVAGETYKHAMVQAIIIIKQPSLEDVNGGP